ncbi:MAG: DUF3298 domain-containing protein [Oscillospiraceae bacterium]|nr:DUF3298 domain-containing protein [Oscillospiraceae bacterium]
MKKTICLVLAMAFLLTGCGSLRKSQKTPEATPTPVATPEPTMPAEPVQQEETAAAEEAVAEEEPAEETEELVLSPIGPGGITPYEAESERGLMIHLERTTREAFDPQAGSERILTFAWDSVQVQSDLYPDAASKITETMAGLEDAWYTGTDSGDDAYAFGYSSMLGAAEDNYNMAQQGQGMAAEFSSTRYVTVLRADSEICVFLINYYVYMAGAHGSYKNEAICFDTKTGERLTLANLSGDEAGLKAALLSEMNALAAEDRDGYYSERITGDIDRATAFPALIREGSWYPAAEGFVIFSDIYELGPYAAGIAEFVIPYENLASALDARFVPQPAALTAEVEPLSMDMVPEGSIEIADRVAIGDSGDAWLLFCQGEAQNLSLWTGSFGDSFYPEAEVFFCGSLKDAALQVSLEIPGDLPNAMLKYTDADGEHEYLIELSGENGDLVLVENNVQAQG